MASSVEAYNKAYGEQIYSRILSNRKVSKKNKEYIKQHMTRIKAQDLDSKSIIRHMYSLEMLLKGVRYKDLKKVKREDIEKAVAELNSGSYSEETRNHFYAVWKKFYKDMIGDGLQYPLFIAWLRPSHKEKKKLIPEELLSDEEITRLSAAADNLRDKLFVQLLAETGCRISEILALRKKDILLDDERPKIKVTGKTGYRAVHILSSIPMMANYLDLQKNLKEENIIWRQIGVHTNDGEPISYAAARKLLRVLAKKAGIKKRVNPHSFRKSAASMQAHFLSNQELRARFGWVPSSNVVDDYIAEREEDVGDAYMRGNGIDTKPKAAAKPKAHSCPRCGYINAIDNQNFCGRCGQALDLATTLNEERLQKMVNKSAVNRDYLIELVNSAVEERLEREAKDKKKQTQ